MAGNKGRCETKSKTGGGAALVGLCLLLLILAALLLTAVFRFPFDPPLPIFAIAAALLAIGLFAGGFVPLVLAKSFNARIAGMHVMVAAAALLLVFVGRDAFAWFMMATGWATIIGLTYWGRSLLRQPRERAQKGEER